MNFLIPCDPQILRDFVKRTVDGLTGERR